MNIKPQTEALARILNLTGRAVKHNAAVPVLTAVLFEADKEKSSLTVSATDMELSIKVTAGQCEVEESGKAAIRAGLLAEVVRSLDGEKIEISSTDSEATLSTEKGSYSINAYKAEDFPTLPDFPTEKGSYFTVPADALAKAIEKVLPFTSGDHLRPVLTGALVTFEDGELTMAATDSYRLGVASNKLKGTPDTKVSQIIPARGLKEVARLASITEEIHISITDNQAMFAAPGVTIATRLIDGNYPEYKRLMPPDFAKSFRVNRKELMASLKRVNLFCGKTNPPTPIRLSFTTGQESLMGDELAIAGFSQEIGAGREVVGFTNEGADKDGDNGEAYIVAFNPSYLMASVATAGTEDVIFKFNEPLKPAMVFPAEENEDGPSVQMLLMPMRVQYAEDEKSKPNAGAKAQKAGKEETQTKDEEPEAAEPEDASGQEDPAAEEEKVPVGVTQGAEGAEG